MLFQEILKGAFDKKVSTTILAELKMQPHILFLSVLSILSMFYLLFLQLFKLAL